MKFHIPDPGQRRTVRLRGSDDASFVWWMAELIRAHGAPVLCIVPESRRLRRIETNLRFFLGTGGDETAFPVCSFPAWDVYPYARLSPSSEILGQRLKTLDFLVKGGQGAVLTTPEALAGRLPAPARLLEKARSLREGGEIDRDALLSLLEELMYQRRSIVESPGEYAFRGGIVDFFSPHLERPVRVELNGDEVDSLRDFHPQTQRTRQSLTEVFIFPAREVILEPGEKERVVAVLAAQAEEAPELGLRIDRLIDQLESEGYFPGIEGMSPLFLSEMNTLFDFVPGASLWVCDAPEATRGALRGLWGELREEAAMAPERGLIGFPPEKMWLAPEEVEAALSGAGRLEVDALGLDADPDEALSLQAESLFPARGGIANFVEQLLSWRASGCTVALVAADRTEALRAQAVLREREISIPLYGADHDFTSIGEGLFICEGALTSSFRLPAEKKVFYRTADLFVSSAAAHPRRRPRKSGTGESLRDLKPNDFVVHVDHGVGRFIGVQALDHDGGESEFLAIAYAGADKLYVPMDDVDRVHIYRGGADSPPLDRLGGSAWEKTKKGVKKAFRTIARDLLRLYAERASAVGNAFASDGAWEREISAGFEYEETPDQDQAIRDVLEDMESARPMDRLVCGDVGYGKTEVALRAAARAVAGGKQVALIVPTTLLAHQHWESFLRR
ncbi:MAG: DEAD/DEAH box helicase, partial [bacterium]|nr:DEAD/DEAH box helicase [bacterium]